MNILVTADFHIHSHRNDERRIEDGLQCLEWVYKTAEETECKRVVIAGDFLHNRFSLNVRTYAQACRVVAKYADRGMRTIFVLGNHDMVYENSWDIHSLVPIKDWALVIDKPTTLEIEGIPIDFLPYTPTPTRYLSEFKTPSPTLISHLAVAEALFHAKFDIKSVEDDSKEKEVISPDVFKPWQKVWLGHYHYGQRVGSDRLEYVGSPMQLTFGEATQVKRVAIYNIEKVTAQYVVNDISPKFHIIDDTTDLEPLDMKNAYVEMRTKEDIHSKFSLRKKISKLGAREIEFVAPPVDVAKAAEALDDITQFVHDREKMVCEYVDGVQVRTELDKAKLKKIGIEIVTSTS